MKTPPLPEVDLSPIFHPCGWLLNSVLIFSAGTEWEANWRGFDGTNGLLVNDPTGEVPGISLTRKDWLRLNRFPTGDGRCNDWKFKWGQTDDPFCDCGSPQMMNHIDEECPL